MTIVLWKSLLKRTMNYKKVVSPDRRNYFLGGAKEEENQQLELMIS
jgi:hypothetical protein